MSKPWVRLYRSALNNSKVQKLGLEGIGFWMNCLIAADDDGYLPSDLAWAMRLPEDITAKWLSTLLRHGLVTRDVTRDAENVTDETSVKQYRLHDWDHHQHKADYDATATERKRRQREKQRNSAEVFTEDVTVSVTRDSHDDVTRTDTDTDTDTDKKNIMSGSVAPDGYPDTFESFWKAYPRTQNMSKAAAFKAWQRVKGHLPALQTLLAAVAKYRAFLDRETQKQGRTYPPKHAQGWLSERRWEGFIADEKPAAAATEHAPDWADSVPEWRDFKAKLPPAHWALWFASAHPNGSVTTLVVPSAFAAQEIEKRFGAQLVAHFGSDIEIKFEPATRTVSGQQTERENV